MNKEIKEIIDIINKNYEDYIENYLSSEDVKKLVDYITNLQETINKTIEYIEENCIDDEFYINLTNKEKNIFNILNILKGDSDE